MPRIVIAVFGSLGDLHPCIAIGRELVRMGYAVTLASHADYAERVAAAGLGFIPMRPSFADLERQSGKDRRALTADLLRHPTRLYTDLILPFLRAGVADLESALTPDDVLWVTTAAISARLVAERRRAPWYALALQPSVLLSAADPPRLPPLDTLMRWAIALGPAAVKALLAVLRLGLHQLGSPIRQLRAEWRLPTQAADPILGAALSPHGTLALYSSHFAPLPSDLTTPVIATGFARYDADEHGKMDLDPALSAFLAAGTPPVVLTLGSSFVWNPGRFYLEGLAAVRSAGYRAILLMGEAADDPSNQRLAADDVIVSRYAPYSTLLPHAAAVIHQGGIGTCAQALQAGIPQLVVPHFGDQPDNAHRLQRLGVAAVIKRSQFTATRAARCLTHLMQDPDVLRRAEAISQDLRAENGALAAAQSIASWADRAEGSGNTKLAASGRHGRR
jgi:UDP:flavonoid glycosyltransferase YjiC (YdhE family)